MKQRILIFVGLLATVLRAQEAGEPIMAETAKPRVVLEQTTVPQKDGGSVTFQRIVPPPVPEPVVKVPLVLTAEEAARQAEVEAKMPGVLSISASVHAGGITVLRWMCDDPERVAAVSNVDFRLLAGLGHVETAEHYYSLILAAGEDAQELTRAQAEAARALPQDGSPGFVLLDGKAALTEAQTRAVTGMKALHAYFEANREALVLRHAQREAERAARELAERDAPPPPPRQAVIQFWPLSAEQKAALSAERSAALPVKSSNTGGAK